MNRNPLYGNLAFKWAFWFARIFPRPVCQFVATLLGRISYALSGWVREALRVNLAPFVNRNGGDLEKLSRSNVANFSRMLADYFYCSTGDPARIAPLLGEWRGIENIQAARARGKGTILITAHLGNWELGGMLLALEKIPMTVITLEEPTTQLTALRDSYRSKLGIKTIAIGSETFAFVEVINTLRNNGVVAMLIDRPLENSGTAVQFFGRDTFFSTGPALLWQHTDATVLPAFVLRKEDGRYLSMIEPGIPLHPGENPREALGENTQRMATVFEGIIRNYPDQWYNYVPIWKKNPQPATPCTP